jgi:hypothetical protein
VTVSMTSRVVGTYPLTMEQHPAAVSLFPGTSERVTVSLTLPADYPAGDHLLPVELVSAVDPLERSAEIEVSLDVAPVVAASMDMVPSEATGGRRAKFSAHVANTGNTPLNLSLTGLDPERALTFSFDPPFVRVDPGQHVYVAARTTGKRPMFGLPYSRQFTLHADGPGVALQTSGRVNQKPWIARGFVTALVLAMIIGLWAVVFTAGAELVLSGEKLAKSVPAAFLAGEPDISSSAVAGTMVGTIKAASDGSPVERMSVEAYLLRRNRKQLVSSAASIADGTWSIDGLLPGRYHLRFTAPGFQDVWYPSAPDDGGAEVVRIRPTEPTEGLDVEVQGLPGSISGAIAAGEQQTINGIVNVNAMKGEEVLGLVATVPSNPDGTFTVPNLPTPATYQLKVSLDGFTDQTVTTLLGGGEQQVVNTVQMAAGQGTLGGTITSDGEPLGGVVITVVGGGATYTATTPTSGPIGQWSLTGLPTPATYVVTFAAEGYGTQTTAIDLAAGSSITDLDVELVSGTGSVAGLVSDTAGKGLGDVTVTVTGSATPIVTKTLTTGDVGRYLLSGLVTPGRYTITFSLEGYSPVTRAVVLGDSGLATDVNVTLGLSTGSIVGTVTSKSSGARLPGAKVTLGDGKVERATVSADQPPGEFRFDALPAGTYTVIVELPGYKKWIVNVEVQAGAAKTESIALEAS